MPCISTHRRYAGAKASSASILSSWRGMGMPRRVGSGLLPSLVGNERPKSGTPHRASSAMYCWRLLRPSLDFPPGHNLGLGDKLDRDKWVNAERLTHFCPVSQVVFSPGQMSRLSRPCPVCPVSLRIYNGTTQSSLTVIRSARMRVSRARR